MDRVTMFVDEVADYIGASPWWIYEQVKKGLLPHTRISGKILFRKTAIDQFLMDQEKKSIEPKQPEKLLRRAK